MYPETVFNPPLFSFSVSSRLTCLMLMLCRLQASSVLVNGTTSASPSGQPLATCAFECTRPATLSARDRRGEVLLPQPSATCTSFANANSNCYSNAVGADGLQRRPPSPSPLFAPEHVLQRRSHAAADSPPPLPLPLTPLAAVATASLDRPAVGVALSTSTPPFPFPLMNASAGVNGGAPSGTHSKRKLSRLYERFKDKFRYQQIRLQPKSTSRRRSGSVTLAKAHEQRRSSSGECLASAEEEVFAATPQHSNSNLSPSEADALQHFDKIVISLGAEPSGSRSATGAALMPPTSPHTLNRHHNASKSSFSSTLRASDSQKHQQQQHDQSHSVPPPAPTSADGERKERRSKSLLLRSAQQLFASSSARFKH